MSYASLESALLDLEKQGQLKRISHEVDPYLELSAIQLENFKNHGPVLLFENVKGTPYRVVSNVFGSPERTEWMFRASLKSVKRLIALRKNPLDALKQPFQSATLLKHAFNALPKAVSLNHFNEISINQLPHIQHWPMDGGAFITLPQVYSEDPFKPGLAHSNLGMYRIQLSGNMYTPNIEMGLHYQLHRGIGIHQTQAKARNEPLRVSIFIGGPPAHTMAAVMPLPEGMSELAFAGVLGNRRFRYNYIDGFCISADADFVITGFVNAQEIKPEGPFGDHLGYYSLKHPFPVMRVHKVYAKPRAIWPFTVVGRPPQEDTSFGVFIHHLTGSAISQEIPGVSEVHAVDAAGVHPLLFAVGSERYTPYLEDTRPAELLTQANRILGTGQLSLAKHLFIAAKDTHANAELSCKDPQVFLTHIWERIDPHRDLHFYTQTSMDTLDYSGESLNAGSKLVIAANGPKIRSLCTSVPDLFHTQNVFSTYTLIIPGVVMLCAETVDLASALQFLEQHQEQLKGLAQIVLYNNHMLADSATLMQDYLWITYTRTNPSHDIYGMSARFVNKHWTCELPIVYDARIKPHHAPLLEMPEPYRLKAQSILQNTDKQHIKI